MDTDDGRTCNCMAGCINDVGMAAPFIFKILCTTSTLLGTSIRHQYFIFGCITIQIMSTLVILSIYYNQLIFSHIWWPLIEFIRICIFAIIRIDQLILSEPNIFCRFHPHRLYKTIALINLLGFIWSFPIWIFYVTLCLSDDTLSQLLFVATLIYISLHIISSLPSLSRLSELCTINKRSMMEDSGQFGYRFFTSSLGVDISPLMSRKHSTISPRRVTFADESEYDEDDDPILFTAPIYE
eukprot:355512_1